MATVGLAPHAWFSAHVGELTHFRVACDEYAYARLTLLGEGRTGRRLAIGHPRGVAPSPRSASDERKLRGSIWCAPVVRMGSIWSDDIERSSINSIDGAVDVSVVALGEGAEALAPTFVAHQRSTPGKFRRGLVLGLALSSRRAA